jgi:hypothetical protein
MLSTIQKIKNWQAILVIALVGAITFASGMSSPFWDDDFTQIVNNPVVQSITHIRYLFEGSTFYLGNGIGPLSGTFYRPLMMVFYSLIYEVFGANALAYHISLLVLCILGAVLLFLVFSYPFSTPVALGLALLYLVQPLNTQLTYAISSIGDALYMVFGLLALWILLRFTSKKSLILVSLSLFLSLLAKETAIGFVGMALLYVLWFDRARFKVFILALVPPVAIYFALKVNAVGFATASNLAPIDHYGLGIRLLNAPEIFIFYMSKVVLPLKLATGYYWVNTHFSVKHVLIPLIVDLLILAFGVYLGILVKRRLPKAQFYSYLFFSVWFLGGMLTCLQIVAIDMTVCETWFCFSLAGLLGMLGVGLKALRIQPKYLVLACVLIIFAFALRSAERGFDWRSETTLAREDIVSSPADYNAYTNLSNLYSLQGKYALAATYDYKSLQIFPTYYAYYDLGVNETDLQNYKLAASAYYKGLPYGRVSIMYENLAALTVVNGSAAYDTTIFRSALSYYPKDPVLWTYLAIDEQKFGQTAKAKQYIQMGEKVGTVNPSILDAIMNDKALSLTLGTPPKTIVIPAVPIKTT